MSLLEILELSNPVRNAIWNLVKVKLQTIGWKSYLPRSVGMMMSWHLRTYELPST